MLSISATSFDIRLGHLAILVAMHVDERELRARFGVLRDDESGARVVLLNGHDAAGRLLLGGCG
jgi:hypothetical protein